jgi:hypothetical protein
MVQKNKSQTKNYWRWLTWSPVVTFSLVFIIYLVVSLLRLDSDFGWHLKSGEYFVSFGIPAKDIFTYTASNFNWINHEWLSDIFMFVIYSNFGYAVLCVVYSAIWTLSMWLVGRKAHNLIILLAVLATVPFVGVRAFAWSILGLTLLVVVVGAKNHRFRLLIPLIFLIWANMHGSFVIGFIYLLYIAIKQRSWQIVALTGVGGLLTLINPYGVSIYTEILRTVGDSSLRWRISEWKPLSIPWMTIPYVLLWLCGFALTGLKKWRKYLGIDVIFFLAGIASMRTLALFIVLSLGITDERIRAIAATVPKNINKPQRRFIIITGIGITLVVIATVVYSYWGFSFDREKYYPKNAVAYLQQHPCSGALFNHYDYGGYLIWKLPSHKVYIDGRMPSWELNGYKYMDEYVALISNHDSRQKQFAKYNIRCVLTINDKDDKSMIDDLLKQKWKVVTSDPGPILLLR